MRASPSLTTDQRAGWTKVPEVVARRCSQYAVGVKVGVPRADLDAARRFR